MSLKYGVLGLLKFGPQTGYDINAYFQHSLSFFWKAQTSQIYRELNKLESEGLATSDIVVQYDKPNRKVYKITEAGNSEFNEWLETGEDKDDIRETFLMKMFFSGFRDKKKSIEALENYIEFLNQELEEISSICDEVETIPKNNPHRRYWAATSSYGVMNCKMRIEWAQSVIDSLKGGK